MASNFRNLRAWEYLAMSHPNLKGWWRLENDALDSSGNGNHGTYYGTNTYAGGVFGRCYSSNDLTRVIVLPASASLNFTGAMTSSAWIRRTADSAYQKGLVDKWQHGGAGTPPMRQHMTGILGNAPGGGRTPYATYFFVSSDGKLYAQGMYGPALPINTWMHVVGTYQPSTAVRLYINGELYASLTAGVYPALYSTTNSVYLGQYQTGSNERLRGQIDDVRLFNCALDANDVRRAYLGMQPTRVYT